MWELTIKKGWAWKNWCFNFGVGEDLKSLWTEDQISLFKGNQPEYFLKTDVAEPVLLHNWCEELTIRKDPDVGRLKAGVEGSRGWDGW